MRASRLLPLSAAVSTISLSSSLKLFAKEPIANSIRNSVASTITTRTSVRFLSLSPTDMGSSQSSNTNKSDTTYTARDQKNAKIWDRFANNYSKSPISDEVSYQHKLQKTQELCFTSNSQVVEVAGGTGGTSLIHAPYVRHILATDVSAQMIEIAKAKQIVLQQQAKEETPTASKSMDLSNVDFRQASIEELDRTGMVGPASKDVVMAHSILHLVDNRDETIRTLTKWLKPGGYLVTSTICPGDMSWMVQGIFRTVLPIGHALGLLPKVNALTRRDLVQSMKNAGLDIVYEWQPSLLNNDKQPDTSKAVFLIGKKK